jgi:chromate transporter
VTYTATLLGLASSFALFSILAVGGGVAVLPEMQALMAERYGISGESFVHIYGIGQLAPGPNMLMVLVLGYRIAGFGGALTVLVAFFTPALILSLVGGRLWDRVGETPWRRAVQNALEPVSLGLMISGLYAIAREALNGPVSFGLCAVTLALLVATRINPVLIVLAASATGVVLMTISGLP